VTQLELDARAATARGDWQSASEYWFALHRREPALRAEPVVQAALALLRLGRPSAALAVLSESQGQLEGDPGIRAARGEARWALGDLTGARAELEAARDLGAEAGVRARLGELLLELGEPSAAARELRGALARRSDPDGSWHVVLARALSRDGQPLEAFDAWEAALRIHEGERDVLVEAAALASRPAVRAGRERASWRVGEWLERVLRSDPQDALAHRLLGEELLERGELERARGALARAAELAPDDVLALAGAAEAELLLGDGERARALALHGYALEEHLGRQLEPATRLRLQEVMESADALAAPEGRRGEGDEPDRLERR